MGGQLSRNLQGQMKGLKKEQKLAFLQKVKYQIHQMQLQQEKNEMNIKQQHVFGQSKNKLQIEPMKKHPMIEWQQKKVQKQLIIEGPKKRQSKYKNQFFECPLCTQTFDVFKRSPMMICMNQHTYCQLCIKQYFDKIKECPECRQPYNKNLIVKHRLLFQILIDQDDDLIMRVIQREILLEQEKIKVRQKYAKKGGQSVERVINPQQQQYIDSQYRQYKQKNANLTEIPSLRLQPILLVLVLDNNRIKKINGMDHLRQLKMLSLRNNQIQKIENLQQLIELKFLFLQSNQIKVVENLINLVSIRQVYLQNNNINKKNNKDMILALRDKGVDMHF